MTDELKDLRRAIERYRNCVPHPNSRAAFLLRFNDDYETVGDELAEELFRRCQELGESWCGPLVALSRSVRARKEV